MRPTRRAFVRQYVIDRNGAAAARRAGYSERGARQRAHTILADPEVQAQIAELDAEIAARAKVDADQVVAEIHRIGFDEDADVRARVRCLEMLAKITGRLVDRQEHSGPNGAPIPMKLSREERTARIEAILGNAIARRAASTAATNGHNGNGSHA